MISSNKNYAYRLGRTEKVHEEITAKNFSNSAKDISMKIKKLH